MVPPGAGDNLTYSPSSSPSLPPSGDDGHNPKLKRYRSLRGRSVSSAASAVGRFVMGDTSNKRNDNNSNSDDSNRHDHRRQDSNNNHNNHIHHHRPASGGQQQQVQRNLAASGNPISRTMSLSRYRSNRPANSVAVSSVPVGSDATQTVQKKVSNVINADPPQPACGVDNPPIVVPPVPAIPRLLRGRSSGGDDRSGNQGPVRARNRNNSSARNTSPSACATRPGQKEEEEEKEDRRRRPNRNRGRNHVDAVVDKVSLHDFPLPPTTPPAASPTTSASPEEAASTRGVNLLQESGVALGQSLSSPPPPPPPPIGSPPRRRRLRRTSTDINSRGDDHLSPRRRAEMTTTTALTPADTTKLAATTTTPTTPKKMELLQQPQSHLHQLRRPSTSAEEKCLVDELETRRTRVMDDQREFAWLEAEAEAEANLAALAEAEAHRARLAEEESNRARLEEQKRKDLERLQAQLAASTAGQPKKQPYPQPSLKSPPPIKTPVIEKLTFLAKAKGRKHHHTSNVSNVKNDSRNGQGSPGLSPDYPPTISSAGGSTSDISHRAVGIAEKKHAPARSVTAPVGIEAGGKGIVPQTDAPASAINSGDRTVTVRCQRRTFQLDVGPETTAEDVLLETHRQMTYDLEGSPSTCVVLEAYAALGLERRLRRYEHVRDVMNSWDQNQNQGPTRNGGGSSNYLVVTVLPPGEDGRELEADAAQPAVPLSPGAGPSDNPPPGFQLHMHHSNRPGKWSKRWVTLVGGTGQIICSKKADAQPSDKDAVSLCRLSDYDIYTPASSPDETSSSSSQAHTTTTVRRHFKPPKKFCFAVKSQQRSTVFVNADSFVQLFCTDDAGVAALFRERVQAWRSWYLVDRGPPLPPPSQRWPAPKNGRNVNATPGDGEGEGEGQGRKSSVATTTTAATATSPPSPGTSSGSPRKPGTSSSSSVDEKANAPPQITPVQRAPKKSVGVASLGSHRLRISVDETPYTLGEFEPLLDLRRFDKRLSQFGRDFLPPSAPDVSTMPSSAAPATGGEAGPGHGVGRKRSVTATAHPGKNSQQKLIDTIKSDGNEAGFTGGGLLGGGYEERKLAHAAGEREAVRNQHHHSQQGSKTGNNNTNHTSNHNNHGSTSSMRGRSSTVTAAKTTLITTTAKQTDEAFTTDKPTLLGGGLPPPSRPGSPPTTSKKPESPSWFPSALEHSAKQRATSSTATTPTTTTAPQPRYPPPPPPPLQRHGRHEKGETPQRPSTSAGVVTRPRKPSVTMPLTPNLARPPTSSGVGDRDRGFGTSGIGSGSGGAFPLPRPNGNSGREREREREWEKEKEKEREREKEKEREQERSRRQERERERERERGRGRENDRERERERREVSSRGTDSSSRGGGARELATGVSHPNPLRSSPYLGAVGGAMSHSNRRERPKPLVNLADSGGGDDDGLAEAFNDRRRQPPQEVPRTWREKKRDLDGRGVVVPDGMHNLIDLISVSDSPKPNNASSKPSSAAIAPSTSRLGSNHSGGNKPAPLIASSAPPTQTTSTRRPQHHSHRHDGSAGKPPDALPPPLLSPPARSAARTSSGSGSGSGSRSGSSGTRGQESRTDASPAPRSAPLPLSRARSKTAGAPAPTPSPTPSSNSIAIPTSRFRASSSSGGGSGGDKAIPPVPALPSLSGSRPATRGPDDGRAARHRATDQHRAGDRQRDRERERKDRDYNAFNAVPGRTGTLKVV